MRKDNEKWDAPLTHLLDALPHLGLGDSPMIDLKLNRSRELLDAQESKNQEEEAYTKTAS